MSNPRDSALRLLRDGWDEIECIDTEMQRRKTVQEKLADYDALMAEFGGEWKPEVEAAYQAEREQALIAIQEKLARLQRYRDALADSAGNKR